MDYLKTNRAVKDYCEALIQSKQDKSLFHEMWGDKLADNGVDVTTQDIDENDFLPYNILEPVKDNVRDSVVLSQFNITYNIQSGMLVVDGSDSSSFGHKKLATKKLLDPTMTKRAIIPEALYVLKPFDHMTYLKGGALIQWALTAFPRRVVNQLERAIIAGGIKNEDSTDYTAIYPLMGDSLATQVAATDIFSGIIDGIAAIDGENKVVFMNASDYASLLNARDPMSVALVSNQALNLGAKIVPTNLVPAAVGNVSKFVVVNTPDYFLGFAGTGIETLTDFAIKENAQYIESRAYAAGSITRQNSLAEVTVTPAPKA